MHEILNVQLTHDELVFKAHVTQLLVTARDLIALVDKMMLLVVKTEMKIIFSTFCKCSMLHEFNSTFVCFNT